MSPGLHGLAAERGETTKMAEQRMEALVGEVVQLRETVQSRVGHVGDYSEVWRPPKRAHDLPDADVVTLESQREGARLRAGCGSGGSADAPRYTSGFH